MRNIFLPMILLCIFSASQVGGTQIVDPKSQFSVNFDFPGSSLCIFYPPELKTVKNCSGLKIPDFGKNEETSPVCSGVVRGKGFNVVFKVDEYAVPHAGPVNEKIGQDFLKGFLNGAKREMGGSEIERLEEGLVTVKEKPIFRYHGDIQLPNSQHARILLCLFSGLERRYSMYFLALGNADPQLLAVSDRVLQSVKVPLPTGSYEAENANRSEAWGAIFDGIYHLLMGVFFIWLFYKLFKSVLEYRRNL